MLPLMHNQGLSAFEHLFAIIAFEFWVLMLGKVKLQMLCADTAVSTLLARILVVGGMLHDLVTVHLGLVVEGEEADGASRGCLDALMDSLDVV